MTLTELAVYLDQLFPGKAPTRLQLVKARQYHKIQANKVFLAPENPFGRYVWDVSEDEVQRIIEVTREHIKKGTLVS